MKILNYSKLQPLSKNTHNNKTQNSDKSIDIMLGLMDYNNNFEEYIRSVSMYEASSLIISEQDWLKRHKYSFYNGILKEGQICKIDFGKTYNKENAYIHYALVIRIYKNKCFVIPMTTSPDKISKAFHPIDNHNGEYKLRLAKEEEGFPKKSVLYMNDAKFINSARIIESLNLISLESFREIKLHLISIIFPYFEKEYRNLKNDSNNLKQKLNEIDLKYKELESQIISKEIEKNIDNL